MPTDKEIIAKLKITPKDRVLDVGGSMKQYEIIKVDTLVDIIRPEEAPYTASKLKAKNFVRLDVTRENFPFADKEFDICLCTHTLEDLSDPSFAMREMARVAKRGLIVTPSMGRDMLFSHIDYTDWLTGARRIPGQAHHKWFFQKKADTLIIIPKNYPLLYTRSFGLVKWLGEAELEFFWEGEIKYFKVSDIDIHKLADTYREFIEENSHAIKIGKPMFFLDSPYFWLKAVIKLLFKKGIGYKKRESI